jgi:hypothetical protein
MSIMGEFISPQRRRRRRDDGNKQKEDAFCLWLALSYILFFSASLRLCG